MSNFYRNFCIWTLEIKWFTVFGLSFHFHLTKYCTKKLFIESEVIRTKFCFTHVSETTWNLNEKIGFIIGDPVLKIDIIFYPTFNSLGDCILCSKLIEEDEDRIRRGLKPKHGISQILKSTKKFWILAVADKVK